jgi:hypothetical protein
MNSEKILLTLLVIATAYSFIVTVLLLASNAKSLTLEEELIDQIADKKQIAQALKEIRETKQSPVKGVVKSTV